MRRNDHTVRPDHCLNCHAGLSGDFCAKCGQASSTERYTFKSFAREIYNRFHTIDTVATFHTFLGLLIEPGKFVSQYLAGKRVGYTAAVTYFFYFFVVEIAVRSLLFRLTGNEDLGNTSMDNLQMQVLTLASTIFWGCLWYLFYRKSPLNLFESIIAAIYFVAQVNIFSLILLILSAPLTLRYPWLGDLPAFVELGLYFAYGIFFCRRLFREPYWRLVPKQLVLSCLFIVIVMILVFLNGDGTDIIRKAIETPPQ